MYVCKFLYVTDCRLLVQRKAGRVGGESKLRKNSSAVGGFLTGKPL